MGKRRKLGDDPLVRAIRSHGLPTVQRALNFALAWGLVANRLGHVPTIEEYREWWGCSERTAYREQAAFRAVTGLEDPSTIVERASSAGVELDESAGSAGGFALLPYMEWEAA